MFNNSIYKRIISLLILISFLFVNISPVYSNPDTNYLASQSHLQPGHPSGIGDAVRDAAQLPDPDDLPGGGAIGTDLNERPCSFYKIANDRVVIDPSIIPTLRQADGKVILDKLKEMGQKLAKIKGDMKRPNVREIFEDLRLLKQMAEEGRILLMPAQVTPGDNEDYLLEVAARVQAFGWKEERPVIILCEEHFDPDHLLNNFLEQALIHAVEHMRKPSLNLHLMHRGFHVEIIDEIQKDFFRDDFPGDINLYGITLRDLINEKAKEQPVGVTQEVTVETHMAGSAEPTQEHVIEAAEPEPIQIPSWVNTTVSFAVKTLVDSLSESVTADLEQKFEEILISVVDQSLKDAITSEQQSRKKGALASAQRALGILKQYSFKDYKSFPEVVIRVDNSLGQQKIEGYLACASVKTEAGQVVISVPSEYILDRLTPKHIFTALIEWLVYGSDGEVILRSLDPEGAFDESVTLLSYYLWGEGITLFGPRYNQDIRGEVLSGVNVEFGDEVPEGEQREEERKVKEAIDYLLLNIPEYRSSTMPMGAFYETILQYFYPRTPTIRVVNRLSKKDEEEGKVLVYDKGSHTITIPRYFVRHIVETEDKTAETHAVLQERPYNFIWHFLVGLSRLEPDVSLSQHDQYMTKLDKSLDEDALLKYFGASQAPLDQLTEKVRARLITWASFWVSHSKFHLNHVRRWKSRTLNAKDRGRDYLIGGYSGYYEDIGSIGVKTFWNHPDFIQDSTARLPRKLQVGSSVNINIREKETHGEYSIEAINEKGQIIEIAECIETDNPGLPRFTCFELTFADEYKWLISQAIISAIVTALTCNLEMNLSSYNQENNLYVAVNEDWLDSSELKAIIARDKYDNYKHVMLIPLARRAEPISIAAPVGYPLVEAEEPLPARDVTVEAGLASSLGADPVLTAREIAAKEGVQLPLWWTAKMEISSKQVSKISPLDRSRKQRPITTWYIEMDVNGTSLTLEAPAYIVEENGVGITHLRDRFISALDKTINCELERGVLNNRLEDLKEKLLKDPRYRFAKIIWELDESMPNGIRIEDGVGEGFKPELIIKGRSRDDIMKLTENDWMLLIINYFMNKKKREREFVSLKSLGDIRVGGLGDISDEHVLNLYRAILATISQRDTHIFPLELPGQEGGGISLQVTGSKRLQALEVEECNIPLFLVERDFAVLNERISFREYILSRKRVKIFIDAANPGGLRGEVIGDIKSLLHKAISKSEVAQLDRYDFTKMGKRKGATKLDLIRLLTKHWSHARARLQAMRVWSLYLSTEDNADLMWQGLFSLRWGISNLSKERRESLNKRQFLIVCSDEDVLKGDNENLLYGGSKVGRRFAKTPIWIHVDTLIEIGKDLSKLERFINMISEADRVFSEQERPEPEIDKLGIRGFSEATRTKNIGELKNKGVDVLVIGAGLLGASIVRQLAMSYTDRRDRVSIGLCEKNDFAFQSTMPVLFSNGVSVLRLVGKLITSVFDKTALRRYLWLVGWYWRTRKREINILGKIAEGLDLTSLNATARLTFETLISAHRKGAFLVNYTDYVEYIMQYEEDKEGEGKKKGDVIRVNVRKEDFGRYIEDLNNGKIRVIGVKVKDRLTDEEFDVYANVIIDATGYTGLGKQILDKELERQSVEPFHIIQYPKAGLIIPAVTETLACREVADKVIRSAIKILHKFQKTRKVKPASTDKEPLPRASDDDVHKINRKDAITDLRKYGVPEPMVQILANRYGDDLPKITKIISENPSRFSELIIGKKDESISEDGSEGRGIDDAVAELRKHGVSESMRKVLFKRYGEDMARIASIINEDPDQYKTLIEGTVNYIQAEVVYYERYMLPYIYAEIIYAKRHGMVLHLDDFLLRRTMLGRRYKLSELELGMIARVLGEELGWDDGRRVEEIARYKEMEIKEFVRSIFRHVHSELQGNLKKPVPFAIEFVDDSVRHTVKISKKGEVKIYGGFLKFVDALRNVEISDIEFSDNKRKDLDLATSLVYSIALHELRGHLALGHHDRYPGGDDPGTILRYYDEVEAEADQRRGRRYLLFNLGVYLWHHLWWQCLTLRKDLNSILISGDELANVRGELAHGKFKWLIEDEETLEQIIGHMISIQEAVRIAGIDLDRHFPLSEVARAEKEDDRDELWLESGGEVELAPSFGGLINDFPEKVSALVRLVTDNELESGIAVDTVKDALVSAHRETSTSDVSKSLIPVVLNQLGISNAEIFDRIQEGYRPVDNSLIVLDAGEIKGQELLLVIAKIPNLVILGDLPEGVTLTSDLLPKVAKDLGALKTKIAEGSVERTVFLMKQENIAKYGFPEEPQYLKEQNIPEIGRSLFLPYNMSYGITALIGLANTILSADFNLDQLDNGLKLLIIHMAREMGLSDIEVWQALEKPVDLVPALETQLEDAYRSLSEVVIAA